MIVFEWINDQLLKMDWLHAIFEWLFGTVFGLSQETIWYQSLTFFFYDVIKIFILLSVLIFLSTFIQSYFPPERTRKILGRFHGIGANSLAALLGTVTPFCSCSSIPIFIGFTQAGLPVGVTFSFLISSPLVDLASVLLLASIFNWKIALAYVLVGLVIAVSGGTLISAFKMEKYVEGFVTAAPASAMAEPRIDDSRMSFKERLRFALGGVGQIIRRVWLYILIGVAIVAVIHGVIPQTLIETVLGAQNPFSVLLATLVGIPMYADIFGTLPIAEALVFKGVGVGTVLAFMMAVTALSLPSLVMLKRVVKTKLLVTFVGIVTLGIILMGYLFNAISFLFI